MHEDMSNGPARPTGPSAIHNNPNLTVPYPLCLSDEERVSLGQAVAGVIAAFKTKSEVIFDMAMNQFADLGSHMVGHGLAGMNWSALQTAFAMSGMEPHDADNVMVVIAYEGESTEAEQQLVDMASEFIKATYAGAHASAMDLWAAWVNSLPEDDWDTYAKGVMALLQNALEVAGCRLEEDADATAMLGTPTLHLVHHCQDHDHN